MGGYRLDARCETCGVHKAGFLAGDTGEDIDALVRALTKGWQLTHEGHDETFRASYVVVGAADSETDDESGDEPGVVS